MKKIESLIIGVSLVVGLFLLGTTLGKSIIKFKSLDRTVSVKGLAQKEVLADKVIWPISYIRVENSLSNIYLDFEKDTKQIVEFLKKSGFSEADISISAPSIVDKVAQNYGTQNKPEFRYSGTQVITLYTDKIDIARKVMTDISKLGKLGITFKANSYENKVEYLYTKLNEIKPKMIATATKNARKSAQKFAEDSQSKLGKIKSAKQGQFSIYPRDKNTPYIKKVRIVSTVEYYLSD